MNRHLLLPCFLLILAYSLPVTPTPEVTSVQAPPSSAFQAPSAGGPGRTYYVATDGSDSNPGTRQQPWASPGYASRQLQPGDTLIILGGRYILSEFDADILIPPSGTASAWITIRGEEGNRPILAGRNNLLTAVILAGVSYVRLENIEITHDDSVDGQAAWFRDGLQILYAPSSHIVLEDLYIHHVDEFGMNIQDVDDLQILDSRIEYAGFGALGGPAGDASGWRNVVIRNTSLSWSGHYYQGGNGSNRPYARPDGFGIELSQGPILLEGVIAEHNYGDGLDSKAANTTIRQTIVANNSCDGIKLWGPGSRIENTLIYGRGDGNPEPTPWAAIVIAPEEQADAQFEIVNVTVDDFLGQNYLMYVQYDYPNVPAHVKLRNVIFSSRGPEAPIYIAPASTLVADHNLFFFPQNEIILTHGEQTYTCANLVSLGSGNLCGDPLFVRPAWGETGDYRLRTGSPAIDAGDNAVCPPIDQRGATRPQDSNGDGLAICEIGAFEDPPGPTFLDIAGHWAENWIEALAAAGITSGYPDGTYRPENSVTRAEMAVFLLKAMNGASYTPPNVSPAFSDTAGHWAEDWIEALKAAGITSGYPDGTYRPENQVTRAEMAVFLLKAKNGPGYNPPNVSPTFSDTAGHWAEDWIEALRAAGITSGYPDGTYRPNNPVTRAEMAALLVRTFLLPPPIPTYALRFYGTGSSDIDRLKIPMSNSSDVSLPVNIGATDFTIEFWMRFMPGENNSGACTEGEDTWIYGNIIFDRDIFGTPDYGDFGISLYGGRVAFGVHNGSSGYTICGNTMLTAGQWHHIAVTRRTDGDMRIFVDGMLDRQYNGPAGDISYRVGRSAAWPNEPYLVIGAEKHDYDPNAYPSFSGWLDEIRISNVARYSVNFIPLTAPFVPDANTVGLYHLDEGSGTFVLDSSGASGGPSHGERRVGGPNNGPTYDEITKPF